jgi:hypothetical protein
MRVIDQSEYRNEEGKISVFNRISGTLEFGVGWYPRMQAQDTVSRRLKKVLGDEYVFINNLNIPHHQGTEPINVLVGPQGISVVMISPLRGVYRAKADDWMRFDSQKRRFKRVRPNLQTIVLNMTDDIANTLKLQGFSISDLESVLIFTHPRTLIDSARPRTRVISSDAIEYFAANFQQLPPSLSQNDIETLVEALLNAEAFVPEAEETIPEPDDTFQVAEGVAAFQPPFYQEEEFPQEDEPLFDFEDELHPADLDSFGSTPDEDEDFELPARRKKSGAWKYWLVLGIMGLLQILLIAAFIWLVIMNTRPL